jgi:hypothetical protein
MFSKVLGVLHIASLLLFISCADKSDDQKLGDNSLQIETVILNQNSEGCENNDPGNCAKIKIEYIVLKTLPDLSAMEKINSSIQKELLRPIGRERGNKNFEVLMQNFIDEYNNFKKEFPEAQQEWEIERKAVNNFSDDNILSCTFSEYSYLGGAHPNTFLTLTNFNLKSGEIIDLPDILIDGYPDELNNIAEPIFRKEKELTVDINLTEAGFWFDDDKFSVSNNFAIGKDGLTFFYNSYEITAYAYGPTELFIPYKSIKKLIKPDGLLTGFIRN